MRFSNQMVVNKLNMFAIPLFISKKTPLKISRHPSSKLLALASTKPSTKKYTSQEKEKAETNLL
jgi:hypothetical protein